MGLARCEQKAGLRVESLPCNLPDYRLFKLPASRLLNVAKKNNWSINS
jgi:hypothetical protein